MAKAPLLARFAVVVSLAAWSATAQAIILYDTGDPNANTTSAGAPANSGWDYEGNFGAYVGTPIAPNYFLSAKHLNQASSTFDYDGHTYTIVSGISDPNTDFTIWKVNETFPTFAPVYTAGNEIGKTAVIMGRGRPRDGVYSNGQAQGWNFGSADNRLRWSENVITNFYSSSGTNNVLMVAKFSAPGAGSDYIANEGAITTGDSGGGVFVQDTDGVWKLAGINSYIDAYSTNGTTQIGGFSLYDTRSLYSAGPYDTYWHLNSGSSPVPGNMYFSRTSTEASWLQGATNYWKVDASGNWNSTSNWSQAIPNTPGSMTNPQIATFTGLNTGPRTVTVNAPVTISDMNFISSNAYTIAGTSAITLTKYQSGSLSTVGAYQGSHTISAPLILGNNNAAFDVGLGSSLSVSGGISSPGGYGWFKTGSGTLSVSGPISTGSVTAIEVDAGTMNLNSDCGPSMIFKAFSTTNFGASQHTYSVNVGDGAVATLLAAPNRVLTSTHSLTIGAAGKLDLTSNAMIVYSDSSNRASVLATVTSKLATGYNGGAWNGYGVNSSVAAADGSHLTSLGVMLNLNAQGNPIVTTFKGEAVDQSSILVRFTYAGDANLSGGVDALDYAMIDNGFNFGLSGWQNGDFNYDGSINAADYAIIDSVFMQQGGGLADGMIALHSSEFGSSYTDALHALAVQAVPEPASWVLLSLGLAGLWAQRKLTQRKRLRKVAA